MKDSLGRIIYVGKSKNLKKRVQSYFQNSKAHPQKIKMLVKNLKDFKTILTDTEFEAFMLECKLIKEFKPIYNKKMKNPLSYTYIVIQMEGGFRNIKITHSLIENDCHLYFGPYPNKNTVERAIQGIKDGFQIICSNPSSKHTACLNYSLGLCMGMCLGGEAVEKYNHIMNKIIALLNGSDMSILEDLKQRMLDASEKFDFETAAKYRDYIEAINFLIKKEKVIEFTEENHNIAMIERLSDYTIKLFLLKGNKILFTEKYVLDNIDMEQSRAKIKKKIFSYFMTKATNVPMEVSRYEIDEAQIIYSYLKGSSCRYINIPEKWLDTENHANLDEALNKLLSQGSINSKQ